MADGMMVTREALASATFVITAMLGVLNATIAYSALLLIIQPSERATNTAAYVALILSGTLIWPVIYLGYKLAEGTNG